jgi:acyl carrier protein
MLNKDTVHALIFQALKNVNDERGPDEQLDISPNTILFGTDAVLDSLSLVSVIVDVEAAVSDASGRDFSLTDDRAMSQAVSPFSDVSTLTDYILLLLSEAA